MGDLSRMPSIFGHAMNLYVFRFETSGDWQENRWGGQICALFLRKELEISLSEQLERKPWPQVEEELSQFWRNLSC